MINHSTVDLGFFISFAPVGLSGGHFLVFQRPGMRRFSGVLVYTSSLDRLRAVFFDT